VRIIATILGIVVAACGGVIAYRAIFLEPTAAVVITETEVRELPNTFRVAGGIALLAMGAIVAFFALRRRNS
jgi:multidrug efflux pump subunit AcrA (membrane-fusion protein)